MVGDGERQIGQQVLRVADGAGELAATVIVARVVLADVGTLGIAVRPGREVDAAGVTLRSARVAVVPRARHLHSPVREFSPRLPRRLDVVGQRVIDIAALASLSHTLRADRQGLDVDAQQHGVPLTQVQSRALPHRAVDAVLDYGSGGVVYLYRVEDGLIGRQVDVLRPRPQRGAVVRRVQHEPDVRLELRLVAGGASRVRHLPVERRAMERLGQAFGDVLQRRLLAVERVAQQRQVVVHLDQDCMEGQVVEVLDDPPRRRFDIGLRRATDHAGLRIVLQDGEGVVQVADTVDCVFLHAEVLRSGVRDDRAVCFPDLAHDQRLVAAQDGEHITHWSEPPRVLRSTPRLLIRSTPACSRP